MEMNSDVRKRLGTTDVIHSCHSRKHSISAALLYDGRLLVVGTSDNIPNIATGLSESLGVTVHGAGCHKNDG
jgi:hypothetical protein